MKTATVTYTDGRTLPDDPEHQTSQLIPYGLSTTKPEVAAPTGVQQL